MTRDHSVVQSERPFQLNQPISYFRPGWASPREEYTEYGHSFGLPGRATAEADGLELMPQSAGVG